MKITQIKIGWGHTKNTGNYESDKAYAEFHAHIGENETRQEVVEKLEKIARDEVKRMLAGEPVKKIVFKNKPTAKDYF